MEMDTLRIRNNASDISFKDCLRRIRLDGYSLVERSRCIRIYYICLHGNVDWPSKMATLSIVQEAPKSQEARTKRSSN